MFLLVQSPVKATDCVSLWLSLPCLVQLSIWFAYTCRTSINFGTWKAGRPSLKVNSLPSKNCFSYRNILHNSGNVSSKMVYKTRFCQNVQHFVHFRPYDLVQISLACDPNTYQIMYGGTFLNVQCQHLQRKSFYGKFTAKN